MLRYFKNTTLSYLLLFLLFFYRKLYKNKDIIGNKTPQLTNKVLMCF